MNAVVGRDVRAGVCQIPWHGWPPAPARPTTGEGSPTKAWWTPAADAFDMSAADHPHWERRPLGGRAPPVRARVGDVVDPRRSRMRHRAPFGRLPTLQAGDRVDRGVDAGAHV